MLADLWIYRVHAMRVLPPTWGFGVDGPRFAAAYALAPTGGSGATAIDTATMFEPGRIAQNTGLTGGVVASVRL